MLQMTHELSLYGLYDLPYHFLLHYMSKKSLGGCIAHKRSWWEPDGRCLSIVV